MKKLFTLFSILIVLAGCTHEKEVHKVMESDASYEKLVAVIHAINGSEVSGTVYFEKVEEGVQVTAQVTGLTGEKHGFHIHQYGDCTADDGSATGGHFNPDGMEHAAPHILDRHMGAMGNLEVNEEGIGIRDYVDKVIVLEKIVGRGVVVHAGEDDLVSQPSGDSGPRIGCGVIGIPQ